MNLHLILVNASTISEFNSTISDKFDEEGEKCNLLTMNLRCLKMEVLEEMNFMDSS